MDAWSDGSSHSSAPPAPIGNDGDSEDEGLDEYVPGGYHRCYPGEVYKDRYRIECKLGWGHFSTVWLATDFFPPTPRYVAVKFQKAARQFVEAARDEIQILETVNRMFVHPEGVRVLQYHQHLFPDLASPTRPVVEFIDSFSHNGLNGQHICMVFEVMGPNLLTLMKEYKFQGIEMGIVRKISAHTLAGLDYLHRVCGVIHTDVKPENILVSAVELPPPQPLREFYTGASEYGPDGEVVGISSDKQNKMKQKRNRLKRRRKLKGNKEKTSSNILEQLLQETQQGKKKRRRKRKRGPNSKQTTPDASAGTTPLNSHGALENLPADALEGTRESLDNSGAVPSLPKAMDAPDGPDGPDTLDTEAEDQAPDPPRAPDHDLEMVDVDGVSYVVEMGTSEEDILRWRHCLLTYEVYTELVADERSAERVLYSAVGPVHLKEVMKRSFFAERQEYKLVDLGNACWVDKQFCKDIQTRQYRSPEVVTESGYCANADIWSYACMLYELLTGEVPEIVGHRRFFI
ncbi:MAG: hypothetical protein KVP17_003050 [Porospora cf. gigantea B]|uniref:uncharacterized protein n=1 Tax=Porospora cf. gigantea B TaxID=2853592 RepID=UPI0035718064|nr:MAG: hypothetical protein KVP17_003050 [Porospora cf. gigantea B]